ncbi:MULTISPECIES: YbaB/EbfC family nucleoid-associated protein [unclassified Crossiella]|uniref:YbaB/EbfC family nucleoid-associated protein n=1 Tax=unclassified Crossiella TaxID=2620835 RepID=UPI001FFF5C17|nr:MULTISPECIES: YbaB/EbfC family nucleoid-associated protein [unclassified Crossiella]MCK2242828.1 YbaB/EbfC family nucleoid-associated protein [Crossiella sp. S99.2]MCK2256705.1 YbaB/EbfC family nucleoid-associated protein [Crossiella sp. S99.1]
MHSTDSPGPTATAESPDGLVEVTAGPCGDLHELWLDPRHQRTRDAAALAATILATVRAATATARREATGPVPPAADPALADPLFGPLLRELDRRLGTG